VKVAKNFTDKIPVVGNIIHITDFVLNGVNRVNEAAETENWVDWTRYSVGKVINILTFTPGIAQLLSFIGSGMGFFLQDMC
jgi:hypothetical protein